ncbi:MAG: hypothetical protein FWD31_01340 [Planctomycetaceae bacterium]|nr:hypothetical protein [Planctomycetaceae bacterium]
MNADGIHIGFVVCLAALPLLFIAIAIWANVQNRVISRHNDEVFRETHLSSRTWTFCPHCNHLVWLKTFLCDQCGEQNELMPDKTQGEDRVVRVIREVPCRRCGCALSAVHFSGREELRAICPVCDAPLGVQAGVFQEMIVPIIGRRATGKSAYLAALHGELRRYFDGRISLPFPGVASQVEEHIRQYNNGENIRQTVLEWPSGFVVDIANTDETTCNALPGIRLILYDVAGETYDDERNLDHLKYFDVMDALIILVDPFTLLDVRREYAEQLEPWKRSDFQTGQVGDFEDIVSRIKNGLVEKYRYKDYDYGHHDDMPTHPYLKRGEKHFARCAVVIAKADAFDLDAHIGEEAVLRKQRSRGDLSAADALDLVCREYLVKRGCGNELLILEDLFQAVRCFSVSAFGSMPGQPKDGAKGYQAKRVLSPLLWCLRQQYGKPGDDA